MKRYLILTEKASAAQNFKRALGGESGHFADFDYHIVSLRGHLLTFKEPEEMVPAAYQKQFKSWQLANMPWPLEQIQWQRQVIKGGQGKYRRGQTNHQLLKAIQLESRQGYDAIVIATDTDPSGEGDLLAFDVLEAIGWQGSVLRANFMDESKKEIQAALQKLKDVSNKWAHGPYLKGESRSRWDYLSMQLTRIATTLAKKAGYPVLAREGRLKSVIIWRIYQQLAAIKAYVKKPYFEVQFTDPAGHIFKRQVPAGQIVPWRFTDAAAAKAEAASYHASRVVNEKRQQKRQTPPPLLDLAGIAARLAPQGYSAKEVLATYQKLYEAQYVSYPRTEDRTVTPEQFRGLLPLVDRIAALVAVPADLLTHRQPRKTHVQAKGAHGANRPGEKVPKTLAELRRYGASAQAIYTLVAKSYLAMLAEDYDYEQVTAELADYPTFKTRYNEPINLNFKLILMAPQEDAGDQSISKGVLGPMAEPLVKEGVNPKPSAPTTKSIMHYLETEGVGTGATRVATLSEMSQGHRALLNETKGRLALTTAGEVSAALLADTWIASPKITKRLFTMMDEVGDFNLSMDQVLASASQVVNHDLPVMEANAQTLPQVVKRPVKTKSPAKKDRPAEKVAGAFAGKEVTFNRQWGQHRFTDQEVTALLKGESITFDYQARGKAPRPVTGKLALQTFKGRRYYGFKAERPGKKKNLRS